jgi:hypothetical protein
MFATQTLVCQAQQVEPQKQSERSTLEAVLSFELPPTGDMPGGWSGGPPGTISADDKIVHGGRLSARIQRQADSPDDFSTLTNDIQMDFAGATIELRGFLRTEAVSGFVGLWMREDGETPSLAFDNMESRQLKGTTEWKEYSITLPVKPEGKQLFFGVLLAGGGKAWADDLQLLVDGKPIWEAPKAQHPKTALDLDHEFDGGSRLAVSKLTEVQVENLTTLGKVWGFLKYHHPKVTSGELHWDYELLRILPRILDAPDRVAANSAIVRWIANLGPVAPCNPCGKLEESDLYLRPDLRWIDADARLGTKLSQTLRAIGDNRSIGKQFYVSLVPGVGNPSFAHELDYAGLRLPDFGFQLLALYRFWNIIEYWFPYRDIMEEEWDRALSDFTPKIALAENSESYQRELMALIAKVHDGHANLWSSLDVRPPVGKCQIPVKIRFVQHSPVVTGFARTAAATTTGLKIGDVMTELDGVPVQKLTEGWAPYYSDSNEAARLRDIAAFMTRGACGESAIEVRREGGMSKSKPSGYLGRDLMSTGVGTTCLAIHSVACPTKSPT